jgi:CYTH domain-containing protein
MIEIEKTFLVKNIPSNLGQYQAIPILQGYISPLPTPLRIRKKGDKFELTKKIFLKPNDYSSAEEINIYLTEYEFNKLWPLVEKYLEKIRYLIPLKDNLIAEMDVYQGKLKGLVVVEVEFKSEQEMNNFQPPEWFGKDITQKDFSANAFLAGKSFEEIKRWLD